MDRSADEATNARPRGCLARVFVLGLAGVLFVGMLVGGTLVVYRPDRPAARIEPGSSPGPAFAVQVIRPRAGLPLGGLLPPQVFGLEADLGFGSESAGARVRHVDARRVELEADGGELVLVHDGAGRALEGTEVVFELTFEERPRRVRCRLAQGGLAEVEVAELPGTGELAGRFDLDLTRCEDAATGERLGWPSVPLVLHGSFDRLEVDAASSPR